MSTENKELMQQAQNALSGKWKLAVLTFLVYLIITGTISSIKEIGTVISLLVSGPFALGVAIFSMAIARYESATTEQIFEGFKDFKRAFFTYLLMLWNILIRLLLLIVPGIIASFAYAMTFYILVDDKTISPKEALAKSKQMMDGNKMKLFYLGLRFIPWFLLSIITCGIGLLWVMPYAQVATAKFYDDIKDSSNNI